MGLLTDSFFIRAIKSNSELLAKLPAGDIYNNVADPDYDMENVELPYIIRTEADQAAVGAAFGPATKLAANGWLLHKPMAKKDIEAAGLKLLAVRPVFQ